MRRPVREPASFFLVSFDSFSQQGEKELPVRHEDNGIHITEILFYYTNDERMKNLRDKLRDPSTARNLILH